VNGCPGGCFEGALNCESGSTEKEDQVNWVLCASRDTDRTLAREQASRRPTGPVARCLDGQIAQGDVKSAFARGLT
jgi:hypothetical protein